MAVNRRTLILLRHLAAQVGGIADDTVRELAAAWLRDWDDLSPAWRQAVAAVVDQYTATGVWPAPWQTARIEAVARAQQRTEDNLTLLLTEAAVTTGAAAAAVSAATIAAEPIIIASQLPPAVQAVTAAGVAGAVAATAVSTALAARRQRITDLHRPVIADAVNTVRRVFTRPPQSIEDPVRLAQDLFNRARAGFDSGLTRAATIARTEPIDTYRATAGIVHGANRTIIRGWAWVCVCDLRSCPACWAMHGTRHRLDEPGPLGHPGCRCQRLPLVGDADLPTAQARFRRLSRRDQLAILGPARLALYRSGRIGWGDLAQPRHTPGWRTAYVPTSVRDLQRLADLRAA